MLYHIFIMIFSNFFFCKFRSGLIFFVFSFSRVTSSFPFFILFLLFLYISPSRDSYSLTEFLCHYYIIPSLFSVFFVSKSKSILSLNYFLSYAIFAFSLSTFPYHIFLKLTHFDDRLMSYRVSSRHSILTPSFL